MGKQNPERKGNSLKTFHLTIFWAEIQDTKFGLWIRDVATHLLKKEKKPNPEAEARSPITPKFQ